MLCGLTSTLSDISITLFWFPFVCYSFIPLFLAFPNQVILGPALHMAYSWISCCEPIKVLINEFSLVAFIDMTDILSLKSAIKVYHYVYFATSSVFP